MKIKILNTPEYKKASSRAQVVHSFKRYDGKDVEAFVAATTKKPPVLTKSGAGEPPAG